MEHIKIKGDWVMNNYVEIVTDENGESHFKNVTLVFDAVDIAPPAAPMNVSPFIPAKDVAVIHLPSGWAGGWHPAPSVGHVFVLSGKLSIEVSDGEVRQFPSGSAWLHRDLSGKGHNTTVVGDNDAVIAMVRLAG